MSKNTWKKEISWGSRILQAAFAVHMSGLRRGYARATKPGHGSHGVPGQDFKLLLPALLWAPGRGNRDIFDARSVCA
jgi:hypothetical protein